MTVGGRPILLTGSSGQLGRAFQQAAADAGVAVYAPNRGLLNLSSAESILEAVTAGSWSAIVNCGAYTAVDRAESEPELAFAINAIAPKLFAEHAKANGIPLLHISTDYVFDGSATEPYDEIDPVKPINVYGASKAEGETAIRNSGAQYAIVRTAWLLSANGQNFLNTMLRLATERSTVNVVEDQIGCPTSATDLACALLKMQQSLGNRSGTWHFVNHGQASWYELAAYIFDYARDRGITVPALNAVASSNFPTAAVRPKNARLATQALARDFGITPRPWQEAVTDILNDRLANITASTGTGE